MNNTPLSLSGHLADPQWVEICRRRTVVESISEESRGFVTGSIRLLKMAWGAVTTVITTNQRDFARLAEFCPLQWQTRLIQAI
jgi:hypothetical protein